MAWEPPEGISLDGAFYDVMKKITHRDWSRFARSALRLEQQVIDEIKSDFQGNAREQKYRMLQTWSQNVGSDVSVKYLYAVLNHYLFPKDCPNPIHSKKSAQNSNLEKETESYDAMNKRDIISRLSADVSQRIHLHQVDNDKELEEYCSQVGEIRVLPSTSDFFNKCSKMSSVYKTNHRKGHVLIINNSFMHCPDSYREGSQVDVTNMDDLWKKLGCDVKVLTDLDANDLVSALEDFAKDCKDFDYCVILIMSHGNCDSGSDVILGNDGEKIYVKDILNLFNNVEAPHLQGIPKLFFFQCCRGVDKDSGVYSSGEVAHAAEQPSLPQNLPQGTLLQVEHTRREPRTVPDCHPISMKLPTVSDMLVSYATQFGHQAYRNTEHGSWFINAIANVFMRHSKDEHVLDMMLKVNNAVSAKSANQDGAKAMPHIEFTLMKKLYLYPL